MLQMGTQPIEVSPISQGRLLYNYLFVFHFHSDKLSIFPSCRYIHQSDWDEARRVAENHDPESLVDVLIGQVCSFVFLYLC